MSRVEAVKAVLALADSAHDDDLVALAILGALGEVERGTFALRGVAAIRSLRGPEEPVVTTGGTNDYLVSSADPYKKYKIAPEPIGTATGTAGAAFAPPRDAASALPPDGPAPVGTPGPVVASGPGSFPCPDCDKTLETPQGLGSHRFRSHGAKKPRPGEQRVSTGSAPLPANGLHLYCHCGDRFDHHDQKGLAKHAWSVHKGFPTATEQKPRSAES